jgi:hypothetical protein
MNPDKETQLYLQIISERDPRKLSSLANQLDDQGPTRSMKRAFPLKKIVERIRGNSDERKVS